MAGLKNITKLKITEITVVKGAPDTRTPEQRALASKAMDAWLEAGRGGYTQGQLEEAFDLVKPATHWKDPISVVVPRDKQNILQYAIPWFCGGFPVFTTVDANHVRVEHPGYWVAMGEA